MKKNGFTLIELLAVIAILGILALLITPTVFKSINKFNKNSYQSQILAVENAASEWVSDHLKMVMATGGKKFYLTVGQLKQEGYLEKKLINPDKEMNSGQTKKEWFHNDSLILVTKKGKRYVTSYVVYSGSNSTSTNSNLTSNAPSIVLTGDPIEVLKVGASYSESTKRVTAYDGSKNNITSSVTIKYLRDGVSVSGITSAVEGSVYTVLYSVTANGITQTVSRNLVTPGNNNGTPVNITCGGGNPQLSWNTSTSQVSPSVSNNSTYTSSNLITCHGTFRSSTTYKVIVTSKYFIPSLSGGISNMNNAQYEGAWGSSSGKYEYTFTTTSADSGINIGTGGTYLLIENITGMTPIISIEVYEVD